MTLSPVACQSRAVPWVAVAACIGGFLVPRCIAQDRLPVPAAATIQEATDLTRTAFEDEYAAAKKGDSAALVRTLLDAANKTEVPARKYALLSEAEQAALADRDIAQALEIIDERAKHFDCDGLAERLALLTRRFGDRRSRSRELVDAVYEGAKVTIDLALNNDRTAVASDAAQLAVDAAKEAARQVRAARNPPATDAAKAAVDARSAEADAIVKQLTWRREFSERARLARESLSKNPEDADANATLGSYECFAAKAWHRGLPALTKGNDDDLRKAAAAEIELAAFDGPPPRQVLAVANAWWAASETEGRDSATVVAIRTHAAGLYRSIVNRLDDPIDNAVAEKRAAGAAALGEEALPPAGGRAGVSAKGYDCRKDPLRRQLATAGGATAASEAAVDAALAWLAGHQLPDGGWSFGLRDHPDCGGKCSHSGDSKRADRCGATALALLPFLGRGYTHRDGPYKKQLEKGVQYLAQLTAAGNGRAYGEAGSLYSQGLAGIAICEACGMTRDRRLDGSAQLALRFIMEAQHQGGGWRYSPGQTGDTSASGWNFMALYAGDLARLQVNPGSVAGFSRYLDSVQEDAGAAYGYTSPGTGPGTSAIGLLCRTRMGWKPDHPALQRGAARLAELGPGRDTYFNYYATQVLFHTGGDRWLAWNGKLRDSLVLAQAKAGHETGSWYDSLDGGHGASSAGRLYVTCMAALTLETSYRYPVAER